MNPKNNECMNCASILQDARRWQLVRQFHHRLRLEYWNGAQWEPLYGDTADTTADGLMLSKIEWEIKW